MFTQTTIIKLFTKRSELEFFLQGVLTDTIAVLPCILSTLYQQTILKCLCFISVLIPIACVALSWWASYKDINMILNATILMLNDKLQQWKLSVSHGERWRVSKYARFPCVRRMRWYCTESFDVTFKAFGIYILLAELSPARTCYSWLPEIHCRQN